MSAITRSRSRTAPFCLINVVLSFPCSSSNYFFSSPHFHGVTSFCCTRTQTHMENRICDRESATRGFLAIVAPIHRKYTEKRRDRNSITRNSVSRCFVAIHELPFCLPFEERKPKRPAFTARERS